MHIKRDYSRPLFGARGPQRNYPRLFFFFGLFIGAILVFVTANFDRLQTTAMDMAGFGPTPTPLPGDIATIAADLMSRGEYTQAATMFEQALVQRPENVAYMYEYGKLLIAVEDYDYAVELADRILNAAPSDARGYELKSRAQVFAGDSAAAISVALAGVELRQGLQAELYAVLSRAYVDTGNYSDGVEMGQRAVEADATSVDARLAYANALNFFDLRDDALIQLENAVSLDPNNVQALFDLAFQYLARNEDQAAIDLYDRILAVQPRNANAHLWLCRSYKKVGQFERAEGYCIDSVAIDDTSAGAHYELGMLKYRNYDFFASLESFSRCAEINVESLECAYRTGLSHYYVSLAYRDQGDTAMMNQHCGFAWDTLQDSLVMAQARFGVDDTIDTIRTGLVAIGADCPAYGSSLPNPEVTPEITPETAPTETTTGA